MTMLLSETKDVFIILIIMIFILFLFKCLKFISRHSILSIGENKTHSWRSTRDISQACYCSFCESLLIDGFFCDSCGVCSERRCIKKVNVKLKCKSVSLNTSSPMKHHWVKGNLPLASVCIVCDEECGQDHGLVDFKCSWCNFCVHTACKLTLGEICDYGIYKKYILPPNCLHMSYKRARVKSNLVLQSVTDPGWNDWTPIFFLGNSKSGNNRGGEILSMVRSYLNPLQVVDLSTKSPSTLLEYLTLLPLSARPIIIVAGGDGSVAWLLSDLDTYPQLSLLAVGIIPLGTGNDLARVLGWGSHEPDDITPSAIFQMVKMAKPVKLDRWAVTISSVQTFSRVQKKVFMYNYLSIGVDALVTLKFHITRKSRFYIFSSRIINKLMYLLFGTEQVLERHCKDLEEKVELYMDGVKVDLPSVESIVILNIPSWGAGVPLWTSGGSNSNGMKQQIDDGKLEVAGIYSSFHIAQLQVGLSEPYRIGQASNIRVKLKCRLPMQVDGEPSMQQPGEINICYHNQATVLKLDQ